jgi:O-antigen/teichoic acid export membrane protein
LRRPSLARDATFNTASFALRTLGVLISLAWVARVLGPEGQGRFGFAHWVAAILGQIVVWGLAVAMTRFVARSMGAGRPDEARSLVALSARWLHPVAAATLVVGLPLAAIFGGDLRGPLLLAIPYAVIIGWCGWRIGVAHGLRRFDVVFYGDALHWTLLLAGLGVALQAEDPIFAALATFLAARAVHLALLWVWTDRLLAALSPGAKPRAPSADLRAELWSYALQMAALALFGAVLWDRSELAFLKVRSTYAQIGLYTAAFGLSLPVLRVPAVLSQVMLPLVAGMKGARARRSDIGAVLRRGNRLMSLLMIGPSCVLIAAAPALIVVVFENEYTEAGALLRILLIPMTLAGIGAVSSQVLVGGGGHGSLLKITSWVASLKVWLLIALVPLWGAIGAAVACAVGQLVGLGWQGVLAGNRFPRQVAAPGSRWTQQIGVGAVTAAATLIVGALAGGADRGTSPLLALGLQILAGMIGWFWAVNRLRPLPMQDVHALRRGMPAAVWRKAGPWLERAAPATRTPR